ncbi:MAG TPA: hypothetical protein VEC57_14555 [Candidatus Limnocylindrales bacterium]|nr:hypothetical protein [Candidatus Limnocylindrales bacterium]
MPRLIAGDSLSFETTVSAYPADQGWTLKYRLVPRFTSPVQAPITLTATTYQTSGYQVMVAPGTTALWTAGIYGWSSWVEKTGERITLESGEITVAPDPATSAQGLDTRTDAAIALANVRAVIQGVASKNVLKYEINGRSLEHYSIPDLITLEQKLSRDVAREENAAGMAMGLKNRRQIMVRCR